MCPHAARRARQRGFRRFRDALEAAFEYGVRYHVGAGRLAYYLSRKAVEQARRERDARLEAYEGLAAVVDHGVVVSVYHLCRPRRCWRTAR